MKFLLIALGIAIVLAMVFAVVKCIKSASIATADVDVMTLGDVVAFFKRPGVIEMLKASPDRIAVAIREKREGESALVSLCAFNKRTNKVELPFGRFNARSLDADLLSVFNDKDMIILQ